MIDHASYTGLTRRAPLSQRPSTELSVQVCTSSFWPNTPDVPCILPQDFQRLTKSFERFFNTCFTGRKLSWHAEHGSVDVKVRFDKGPAKELNLATFGVVVLAQFAETPKGAEQTYEVCLSMSAGATEADKSATGSACQDWHT